LTRHWDESNSGEGILTLDRPAIRGQYDSAVNVTSLAVFADCPRKYYLQRYLGWGGARSSRFDPEDLPSPEEPAPEELDTGGAAALGSAVHEILAGKSAEYSPEAVRLAGVFRKSELGEKSAAAERSAREWDFIVDIEGTLVSGTIDLWFEDQNEEIIVVDYKTDAVSGTEAPRRAKAYAPQLALYALAIERAFGKRPAHAWLHFLRPDKPVEVQLGSENTHMAEDLLTRLREAQDELRFDLREGDHCRACQFYRGLCPAGLEQPESNHGRHPSKTGTHTAAGGQ